MKSTEENGKPESLSPAQELALLALLETGSLEEAAKRAGVTTRTVQNWRAEPEFARCYQEARKLSLEAALTVMQGACGLAVKTLVGIMKNPRSPATTKVSAARSILEFSVRSAQEVFGFEERLAAVEARQESKP